LASLNRTTLVAELTSQLRQAILRGRYPLNSRLPTVRRLAAEYHVSTSVVSQAIRALSREGLVASRQGSGTTVLTKPSPMRMLVWTPRQEGRSYAMSGGISFVRFCLTRGVTRTAEELGVSVEPISSVAAPPLAQESLPSASDNLPGVILFEAHGQEGVIEMLSRHSIPFVVAHTCRTDLPYRCVITDTAGSFCLGVAELSRLGHRRIALVTPRPETDTGGFFSARLDGYRRALTKAGIAPDDRLVLLVDDPPDEPMIGKIRDLLTLPDPPTAFACGEDYIALSVLDALTKLGARVPGDYSVIGYDDIVEAAESVPPLTTVHNPLEASAREAVRMLHRIMTGEKDVPRAVMLTGDLVRRSSCAPPPQ